MKVRMMVHMSGTRGGHAWPPYGGVLDIDDDEGAQLCRAGMAVPVVEDRTETAVTPPAEERSVAPPAESEPAIEDGPATTEPSELVALRTQAQELGVKVDGRWQAARLREEIAKASEPLS